jgi:hypothetical protein
MNTVGVFFAWDWLALTVMAIVYFLCPKRFIEEKLDYVKFFLLFLCGYFFLFLIVINVLRDRDTTHSLFGACLAPALWVCHCLYPFKKTKRNQHVSFFLFWAGLYSFGLGGLIIILFALFGNTM